MRSPLVFCAIHVSLMSVSANAQTQSDASPPSAAPEPQRAADDGDALGEIVVTARRREERLQDIPISVSAYDERTLIAKSVVTLRDIGALTPGLRVSTFSNSATSNNISIRGQSNTDVRLNSDPAVGIYIDGVYIPRNIGSNAADLSDIQRIEVLKGPQGTLFGRNTTGGLINITTNSPSDQLEGFARVRLGRFGDVLANAMINVPLGKDVALRIVGSQTSLRGYGTDGLGGRTGKKNELSFRAALSLKLADNLDIILRGDYGSAKDNPLALRSRDMILGSAANREVEAELGLADTTANRVTARNAYLASPGSSDRATVYNSRSNDNVKYAGGSAQIALELGDVTAKSITAYRWFDRRTLSDLDGSPFFIFQYDPVRTKASVFSQELQLAGDIASPKAHWIVGGYYSRESGTEFQSQITNRVTTATWPAITEGQLTNKSLGAFGQADVELFRGLTLTGGIRYTRDTRSLISENRTRTSCTALGTPLASTPNCRVALPRLESDAVSYTVSASYKPTDTILLYAKRDRGYRAGGLPLNGGSAVSPTIAAASFASFEPEFVTDWELGVKAEWLDRHLLTNLSYYDSDYRNIQRSVTESVAGIGVVQRTANAAAGKISGLEAEVVAIPVSGLNIRGTAALTKARFTDYVVGGVSLASTPFLFTPKRTYTIGANYSAALSGGTLRLDADYNWQSDMVTSAGTLGIVKAYGLANARISYTDDRTNIDVAVFVRNLADKRYDATVNEVALGYVFAIAGAPRTFGTEIRKRF